MSIKQRQADISFRKINRCVYCLSANSLYVYCHMYLIKILYSADITRLVRIHKFFITNIQVRI